MSVQHKGKVIPNLIVGDVSDCWEAYVAGGLRRIPKMLAFLMTSASSQWW